MFNFVSSDPLKRARQELNKATSVAVLTGAGISAESGIPTFRDALTGHWARFNPEDLASPDAYARDPEMVWQWYAERYKDVLKAKPNAGHQGLVEIERRKMHAKHKFFLATQNVDGLHTRAGSGRHGGDYVELHGNLKFARDEQTEEVYPLPQPEDLKVPPFSPAGHRMRPHIVWFGEMLPANGFQRAKHAFREAKVALVIGTSSLVQPAASLIQETLYTGGTVIEINPEETHLSDHAAFSFRMTAAKGVQALL